MQARHDPSGREIGQPHHCLAKSNLRHYSGEGCVHREALIASVVLGRQEQMMTGTLCTERTA
jgi:hypothetical protein